MESFGIFRHDTLLTSCHLSSIEVCSFPGMFDRSFESMGRIPKVKYPARPMSCLMQRRTILIRKENHKNNTYRAGIQVVPRVPGIWSSAISADTVKTEDLMN